MGKLYEDWSILRHNDSCNSFLSLLSGIENVSFQYEIVSVLLRLPSLHVFFFVAGDWVVDTT